MGIFSAISSAVSSISRTVSSAISGGNKSTGGTASGAHDTAQSRAVANHTDKKSSTPNTQSTPSTGGGKTIQPTYVSGGAGGNTYRITNENGESYSVAVSGISLEDASKYYAEKAAKAGTATEAAEYARIASDFSAAANYEKQSGILKNYGTGTGITYDATASLMYDESTGLTYLDDTALMYPAGKGSLGGTPVQTLAAAKYAPSYSWAPNYQNPADSIPHTLGGALQAGELIENNGVYIGLPEQKTTAAPASNNLEARGEVQSNVFGFLYNRIIQGSPVEDSGGIEHLLDWREEMYNTAAKYEEEGDYVKWALSYLPAFAVDCIAPLDALETARKINYGKPVEQYELDIATVDAAISLIPVVGAGVKAVGKIVTKAGEKAALNIAEEAGEKAALNIAEEAGEKAARNAAEEAGEKAGKTTLSRAVGIGTTAASVGGTLFTFSLYPDEESTPENPSAEDPGEYDDTADTQIYEEWRGEFSDVFGGAGGYGIAEQFTEAVSAGIDADTDKIIQTFGKAALIAAAVLFILVALNIAVSKKGVKKHYGS